MGCSASQSVATAVDDRENKPIPPPTSFEIPLDDNEDAASTTATATVDSLIKKHPPRRLEERLTKQLSPPQTISDLAEKLANAELRRQSILRERVNNIRNNLKREGFDTDEFITEEEEGEQTNGTATEDTGEEGNEEQQQSPEEKQDLEENSANAN